MVKLQWLGCVCAGILCLGAVAGCEQETAEEVGTSIGAGVDTAAENIEEAAGDAAQAVENAAESTGEALRDSEDTITE